MKTLRIALLFLSFFSTLSTYASQKPEDCVALTIRVTMTTRSSPIDGLRNGFFINAPFVNFTLLPMGSKISKPSVDSSAVQLWTSTLSTKSKQAAQWEVVDSDGKTLFQGKLIEGEARTGALDIEAGWADVSGFLESSGGSSQGLQVRLRIANAMPLFSTVYPDDYAFLPSLNNNFMPALSINAAPNMFSSSHFNMAIHMRDLLRGLSADGVNLQVEIISKGENLETPKRRVLTLPPVEGDR